MVNKVRGMGLAPYGNRFRGTQKMPTFAEAPKQEIERERASAPINTEGVLSFGQE